MSAPTGRRIAIAAVQQHIGRLQKAGPKQIDMTGLSPQETGKAHACYRDAMRWCLTSEYLVQHVSHNKKQKFDPFVRALLWVAVAEIIEGITPQYAIVDTYVDIAKAHAHRYAIGVVNALLRAISEVFVDKQPEQTWQPSRNILPLAGGGIWRLSGPVLPALADKAQHLSIAASHPKPLVQTWLSAHDEAKVLSLLQAGQRVPAILLYAGKARAHAIAAGATPHQQPGYLVWQSSMQDLQTLLQTHPEIVVQDPSARGAVASLAGKNLTHILDYCAGRGTKTKQLATMFPEATIVATDVDEKRFYGLQAAMADIDNVRVISAADLPDYITQNDLFDGVLFDVPCSNTGVLSRRVEARYRYTDHHLAEVVGLQRRIMRQVRPWLAANALCLWSTCSIQAEENEKQATWLAKKFNGHIIHSHTIYPEGHGQAQQDGSYHAHIQLTASN